MRETEPDARVAANKVYAQAVEVAKIEFDMMLPELTRLQDRIGALRRLIHAGSSLINVPVDEKYRFPVRVTNPIPHRSGR